ncbi:MAG: DUF4352 domain-containing protein [Microthrixaceae bacterium]
MFTKRFARGFMAAVVLVAAVFATVAEGEEKSSDSKTTEAPASTQQAPIPLGTAVEVAKGWDVKVDSAQLDANATVAQDNQFIKPDAGKQFVLVNVSITNKSDQPAAVFTNLKLSLLPPNGVALDTSLMGSVPNKIDTTAQLQPGATVTGALVFEVPSDAVNGSVLLGQSVFTLDAKKDQKFFAIQ